jgi:hypothetical protein
MRAKTLTHYMGYLGEGEKGGRSSYSLRDPFILPSFIRELLFLDSYALPSYLSRSYRIGRYSFICLFINENSGGQGRARE